MSSTPGKRRIDQAAHMEPADPRWRDLYKIGAVVCVVSVIVVITAVIAYFVWPYKPGFTSTESVFATIQQDRLGGIIALDFFFLAGTLISILFDLALYVSLKRVNESYALIALALGLIAVVSLIPARPIVEVVSLSDHYAAATTDAARSQYLAAGEALLAVFNGTAWMVNVVLAGISGAISSVLMLRSSIFSKTTAYVGIVANVAVCGFFLPGIGPVLLFLTTICGVVWQALLARRFFQLAWGGARN